MLHLRYASDVHKECFYIQVQSTGEDCQLMERKRRQTLLLARSTMYALVRVCMHDHVYTAPLISTHIAC